ncbi:hypothetical protein H0H87_005179 [Tephrocybe sp. NHM501043]|nr:hypothetical protein H0H87_005179 [Tephrocybe sp. NHM501043]
MNDFDVQDIRDELAKQRAEVAQHQQLMLKMKRIAQNPTMEKEDYEMLDYLRVAASRTEKAKRMGLPPLVDIQDTCSENPDP